MTQSLPLRQCLTLSLGALNPNQRVHSQQKIPVSRGVLNLSWVQMCGLKFRPPPYN